MLCKGRELVEKGKMVGWGAVRWVRCFGEGMSDMTGVGVAGVRVVRVRRYGKHESVTGVFFLGAVSSGWSV